MLRASGVVVLLALGGVAGCEGVQGPLGPTGPLGDQGPKGEPGGDGQDGRDGQDGGLALLIDTDTVWSVDTRIEGPVYVAAGATLELAQGVVLSFLPGSGLFVEGRLVAVGTEASPVVFRSTSSFPETVLGVEIASVGTASTLDWLTFEEVSLGFTEGTAATASNLTVIDGTLSVRDRTTPLTLSGLTVVQTRFDADVSLEVLRATGVRLQDVSVEGGQVGLRVHGNTDLEVTVVGGTFADGMDYPLQVLGDTGNDNHVTLQDLTIAGAAIYGVSAERATVVLDGVTIESSTNEAVYTLGDLEVYDSVVQDTGGDCLSADGTLTVQRTLIERCGGNGLWATTVDVVDTTILDAGSDGVGGMGGSVVTSTISRSTWRGVEPSVEGTDWIIDQCEITDNGAAGVDGGWAVGPAIDVVDSNLTGNNSYGVRNVRTVERCYVADNAGQTGADTGSGGTLDGVRDTRTAQIWDVDQVVSPQSTPVVGAGAPGGAR